MRKIIRIIGLFSGILLFILCAILPIISFGNAFSVNYSIDNNENLYVNQDYPFECKIYNESNYFQDFNDNATLQIKHNSTITEYNITKKPNYNINSKSNLNYEFGYQNIYNNTLDYPNVDYSYINQTKFSESISDYDYSMINGTFQTPNNYISTKYMDVPNEYIDSITYTKAVYQSGTLESTQVDDSNYLYLLRGYSAGYFWVDITLNFNPELSGRNFYISGHFVGWSVVTCKLQINGVDWKTGTTIDFDNELYNGVNSIRYYTTSSTSGGNPPDYWGVKIYYFKLVENTQPEKTKLNFLANSSEFDSNIDDIMLESNDIKLQIDSLHYTNISTSISTEIYNYNTLNYELLWNNTHTSLYNNSYTISSNFNHYFSNDKILLRYKGLSTVNFKVVLTSLTFTLKWNIYPNFTYSLNRNFSLMYPDNITSNSLKFDYNVNISSYIIAKINDIVLFDKYINGNNQFSNSLNFETYNIYDSFIIDFTLYFNASINFQLNNLEFNYIYEFYPHFNYTIGYKLNVINYETILANLLKFNYNVNTSTYLQTKINDIILFNKYINGNNQYSNPINFTKYNIENYLIINFTWFFNTSINIQLNNFQFEVWNITSYLKVLNFSDLGQYHYRYIVFYEVDSNTYNITQEWCKFNVILIPDYSLGILIPFYVYIILMCGITFLVVYLRKKDYFTDKMKVVKTYTFMILIDILLFLCTIQSIQVYLQIGNNESSSWIFTLLNALIFGVYMNVIGFGLGKLFRRNVIKFTVFFMLLALAISGFGYFDLLFKFNFPIDLLLNYKIFGTSSVHGIRFFSSNFMLFVLILFLSFLIESESEY